MANNVIAMTDGTNKIYPKIPCIYYNADTDRTVLSNRIDAINHVITEYDLNHGNAHAVIRYSGGVYIGYDFIICDQTGANQFVHETLGNGDVNVWNRSSSTSTWEIKKTL